MTINSATMIIPGAEQFFRPMYSVRVSGKQRFPDGAITLILMFNKPKTVRLAYTFSYTYLEISEVLEEDVQASTTGSYPERE